MKYRFTLFVSGAAASAERATSVTTALCERLADAVCEIEVVDVDGDPEAARASEISVVPTLILRHPAPERRVLGELRDPESLVRVLQLDVEPPSGQRRVRGRS